MARAMAGTVVYAAEGKSAPKDIGAILDSATDRRRIPRSRRGLYMTGVVRQGARPLFLNNGFR